MTEISVKQIVDRNAVGLLEIAFHEKARIEDYMRLLRQGSPCPAVELWKDLLIFEGRHRVLAYYFSRKSHIPAEFK